MFKPWCSLHCFFLYFFLTGAVSHESVELSSLVPLHSFPGNTISLAVSLPIEDLKNISTSVLYAENWLRTNVLAHYPATNITTILVGHNLLCKKESLILPSIKNIHYSLTRWGLESEIKVSTSFSSKCLVQDSQNYNDKHLKPILDYFKTINAPLVVTPSENFGEKIETLVKRVGILNLNKVFLIQKTTLVPEFAANSPLPPLIGDISPPPSYGPHLPPCNEPAAGPVTRVHNGVWCVAKPSVPPETLQEALDYACGEGGADCEEIGPMGNCFDPDTVVAHASYAFNSYWQKTKGNGGTCGFGGTAMLINSDPSYRHCRFVLE